jgi:Cys-rich repeat protein
MQLRKMMLVLSALGAMSGFMAGCGDDDNTSATCSTNDDCAGTEICHPDAGVCVTTCEESTDCPDSAKTCAPIGVGTEPTQRICQCSTDQLCNGGADAESTDSVCSDLDNVCVPKCSSDDDCATGRVCNTGSGQCEEDDTTGGTCSGEGRSTCSYGQICTNSTCAAPPAPTCQNYTAFPNKGDLGTTGPIIFKTELVSAQTDSFCASSAPKRLRIRVSAYSNTPFPQTSGELSQFFYVQTEGGRQNAPISNSSGNYTVTGANRDRADIIVSLCVAANSTRNSAGFYFSGGNFACQESTYQ